MAQGLEVPHKLGRSRGASLPGSVLIEADNHIPGLDGWQPPTLTCHGATEAERLIGTNDRRSERGAQGAAACKGRQQLLLLPRELLFSEGHWRPGATARAFSGSEPWQYLGFPKSPAGPILLPRLLNVKEICLNTCVSRWL